MLKKMDNTNFEFDFEQIHIKRPIAKFFKTLIIQFFR